MKRILVIVATLINVANAQTIATPTDAFDSGKDFANVGKGVAGSKIDGTIGSGTLPYYGTTAPETANFQEGRNLIGGAGTDKQIQCETYRASSAFHQQECDAVNFMGRNPTQRPKFTIDKQADPIMTGSRSVINNPGSIPGAPTQQCRVERVKNSASYITETCTETQTFENLPCKRILRVACDSERDGCNQGSIVLNSWDGDMTASFTPDDAGNYILQFGTVELNSYGERESDGPFGIFDDHSLTFNIRNVDLITRFALTRVTYNDWIMVKINGNLVYIGPFNGDRLELISFQWGLPENSLHGNMVRYCGDTSTSVSCLGITALSISSDFSPNIDMRPYLRNGSNTIFMRIMGGYPLKGAIQITTRQLCPRNCHDQWDNSQCAPLERRARQ